MPDHPLHLIAGVDIGNLHIWIVIHIYPENFICETLTCHFNIPEIQNNLFESLKPFAQTLGL